MAVPAGLLARATPARAQGGDRQAIDARIAKFTEAYDRKDAEAVGAVFAEDAILNGPGAILVGRSSIAQSYKGRLDDGFNNIRIRFLHHDPAGSWAAGLYTVVVPQGTERRGYVTSIFQRQANALLIGVHTFG